jgi:hypothetical protein
VTNTYFVVEPEQIVAQDLAYAIRACDPLAEVSLFRLANEAVEALTRVRPKAVILNADPVQFMTSAVTQVLTDANIPLAFLGTIAEPRPTGAEVLASPFSEETVAALLRRMVGLSDERQSASGT